MKLLLCSLLSSVALAQPALTLSEGLATPESVLYDSVMDVYVVSNMNGNPAAKDDNGFLSRVAPDGRVVELRWVDGASDSVTLNAPKGMGIRGDTLFVSDIDEVRMFDRTTGRSLGSTPIRGVSFLNDIEVGSDGTVYVTDTGVKADLSPSGSDAVLRVRGRNTCGARASPSGSTAYTPTRWLPASGRSSASAGTMTMAYEYTIKRGMASAYNSTAM